MKTHSNSLVAALAAMGALLSAAPASAEPSSPAESPLPRLGAFADASTAFSYQYVKEVLLDACGWTDRPLNSVCLAQNPADAPSSWDQSTAVACAAPTEPRPTTSWYDLKATAPCPLDPYISCSQQRWEWSDGRVLRGQSWNELHCPSNPAEWGTSLYTVPLATWYSGHVFIQLPALFVHPSPSPLTVRAQVKMLVRASRPYEPYNMPYHPMTAVLALQARRQDGQWEDRAVQEIANSTEYPGVHSLYEVQAPIAPWTEVRLQLRAGSVPAPITTQETLYYRNYRLELDLVDARLVLPECIPDEVNQGQCL